MFYVVEKKFPGSKTFVPMQIASSFDEGVDLIIGLEECDPSEVEEVEMGIDEAGNVFRTYIVAGQTDYSVYSVVQLKRS